MNIKIIFANILGGRKFIGEKYGETSLGPDVLEDYIEAFRSYDADILSLAEIHLEDAEHSAMIERLSKSLDLPFYDVMGSDKSHLTEGKLLGNAVLSKYPITQSDHFLLKSPGIEVNRPNGDHWILHDKPAQTVQIQVGDKVITVTSLHYFSFHSFNRKLNEPDFAEQRQSLVDQVNKTSRNTISFVTGDFNNMGFRLNEAFPELFDAGYIEAIETETSIKGAVGQLDHILYRNDGCDLLDSGVFDIPSDHFGIHATFNI